MTNQEILTKAIQKAAGFNISSPHFAHPLEKYQWDDEKRYWYLGDITIPLFEIIYQHSFAKALWGEQLQVWHIEGRNGHAEVEVPAYEAMLQQMVIADDRIAYLGSHI